RHTSLVSDWSSDVCSSDLRIVGESRVMTDAKALLLRVATSPASTVLLTGESGTGKDLAAKVLHYASDRATRPFMNITCSALPDRSEERRVGEGGDGTGRRN